MVSDYRFRGISLSANHPALQASFTLAHRSGAYAGVWGSTLDGFGVLGGSHLELDLTAGYRATVGKAALDGGLLYYVYPGNKGGPIEFFEPYASVAAPLGRLNARASLAYAPKQVAIGRANLYTALDLALPIARTPLTLNAHAGRSHGRSTLSPGGGYLDWSAGAQAALGKATVGLAYFDANISNADAAAVALPRRDKGAGVVASASFGF